MKEMMESKKRMHSIPSAKLISSNAHTIQMSQAKNFLIEALRDERWKGEIAILHNNE